MFHHRTGRLALLLTLAPVLPAWSATASMDGYEIWYLDAAVGYGGPGVALELVDAAQPDLGYRLAGSPVDVTDYLFGLTLLDVPLGFDGDVEVQWTNGAITSSVGTAVLSYSYLDGAALGAVDGTIRFGRNFELTSWDIELSEACCEGVAYSHSSQARTVAPGSLPAADDETAKALDGLVSYVTASRGASSLFLGTALSEWDVVGAHECFARDPEMGFDDIVACPASGGGPAPVPLPPTAAGLGLGVGFLAFAGHRRARG